VLPRHLLRELWLLRRFAASLLALLLLCCCSVRLLHHSELHRVLLVREPRVDLRLDLPLRRVDLGVDLRTDLRLNLRLDFRRDVGLLPQRRVSSSSSLGRDNRHPMAVLLTLLLR
tara:strand:- start:482 stop:826 length:345 start_codon:yes stop_codon:yes gene_type:complete